MKLRVHEIRLVDHDVWRSAREAIPEQPALLVELCASGVSGFGEASAFMVDRYNSTLDAMHADLRRVTGLLRALPDDDPAAVWAALAPPLAGSPFILAALDVAAHDLAARLAGVPLWRHLGGDAPGELRSSYSIGLDETAEMVRKLRERPGWPAYKVKLATPGDIHILEALREHTDAPFFVDGNCGWDLPGTLDALDVMGSLGVELLEQPFPRESWDDARRLKDASPIPVFADESITGPADLDACATAFDGINLKLMKAGGITPALRMLDRARAAGLGTMLGCMPESSAGVSATAHLGTQVDHLDADSIALIAVDTGTGVLLDDRGLITLPDRPGTGFVPDFTGPAFTVRSSADESSCPGEVELTACREAEPIGSVRVRRRAGLDPASADAWELTGLTTTDGIGEAELAALLRTALTHAAAEGARAVWAEPAPTAAAPAAFGTAFTVQGGELDCEPLLVWKADGPE